MLCLPFLQEDSGEALAASCGKRGPASEAAEGSGHAEQQQIQKQRQQQLQGEGEAELEEGEQDSEGDDYEADEEMQKQYQAVGRMVVSAFEAEGLQVGVLGVGVGV